HAAVHANFLSINLHQVSGLLDSPVFRLANSPWTIPQFPSCLPQHGGFRWLLQRPAPFELHQDAPDHRSRNGALFFFAEAPPACLCPSADTACAEPAPVRPVPPTRWVCVAGAAGANALPGWSGRGDRIFVSSDKRSVG